MINVDGFLFEDEETAKLARKEEEGIRFIKERTALNNPEGVLKLYKKLLEQDLFVTPVGVRFLTELQNILLSSVYIARDDVPPIPVKAPEVVEVEKTEMPAPSEKAEKKSMKREEKQKNEAGNYRKQFLVASFCSIVLGISVIGMFVISALSRNNVNIINYREQLLNEYSSWEAELEEKEERLESWEETLEERESQLRDQMNNGQ